MGYLSLLRSSFVLIINALIRLCWLSLITTLNLAISSIFIIKSTIQKQIANNAGSHFSLTNPNSNNLWSFCQKFLVFEEPALKWINISKTAKRFESNYFLSRLNAFRADPSAHPSVSGLINVLTAFAQGKCFQDAALAKLAPLDIVKDLPISRVDYWQKIAQTSVSMAQLMTLAEVFTPDWQQINSQLPSCDPRLDFILDCIKECQPALNESGVGWPRYTEIFTQCLSLHRAKMPASFIPSAIILVEGATELILLPYFAQIYGINLLEKGALIWVAGGANQIARKYSHLRHSVNLPIFCLFDHDAGAVSQNILPELRSCDSIYVLTDGEIEDLMPLDILVSEINHYLACDPLHDISKPVLTTDFDSRQKRTLTLEKIWKKMALGKFEKVKFAHFVANQTNNQQRRELLTLDGVQMLEALSKSIQYLPVAVDQGAVL